MVKDRLTLIEETGSNKFTGSVNGIGCMTNLYQRRINSLGPWTFDVNRIAGEDRSEMSQPRALSRTLKHTKSTTVGLYNRFTWVQLMIRHFECLLAIKTADRVRPCETTCM